MAVAREAEQIQQATTGSARRRALVAGCIGNLVEWYDFALYGAFATVIAATFFPGGDPVSGLLAAFGVFGVAFLARPVGAVLFARYGDRLGRQRALATGIALMALVTGGIGLLPGYASIGLLAPVLLILLRVGQGVSMGGEYGGSAALVVEYAPAGRRGWYGGWQWATIALGLAAGIAAGALLSAALPETALRSWGWRLAFLLALPLGLIGFYVRIRLEETPGFRAVQRACAVARTPLADTMRTARPHVLVGLGLVASVTLTFNLYFVFLPSYLATSGRVPLPRALAAALVGLLAAAAIAPVAGRISDRVGRRPILLAGKAALLLLTVPASSLALRGETGGLLLGYSLMGLTLGALTLSSFLAELFPTRLRYSGLSLTFGLASALFGASAPLVASFLVQRTGDALLPAWYATCVTAVALACVLLAPETVHRPLDTDEGAGASISPSSGDAGSPFPVRWSRGPMPERTHGEEPQMADDVSQYRSRSRETSGWAAGFILFAALMMIMGGIFQALSGLAGIFENEFYVTTRNYVFEADATTWGWTHLIIGVIVGLAGLALLSGQTWARAVGIFLAVVSAISNFLFIPYYPLWSLLIIALDVFVIWALAAHGRELRDTGGI